MVTTSVRGTSTARLCWQNMGEAEIEALSHGGSHVFADLSSWRKVLLGGRDSASWLNDLVTARVDDLRDHQTRRTLLLSRTGHVMAEFHAMGTRSGLLLVQDPVQPLPVRDLLDPYVLSSDVSFLDQTTDHALLAFPTAGGHVLTVEAWMPSVLGSGSDQLIPSGDLDEWKGRNHRWLEASDEDLEAWRIRRGIPRFGVDLGDDALPAEAGWDALVDQGKGCFLGQEAVARVRNLGHPTRLVVRLLANAAPRPGEEVLADGEEGGRITGVAPDGDRYAVMARIKWGARDAKLRTPDGVALSRP